MRSEAGRQLGVPVIADFRAAESLAMAVSVGERERSVGVGLRGPWMLMGKGRDRWQSRMTPTLPSLVAGASITAEDAGGGEGFILNL